MTTQSTIDKLIEMRLTSMSDAFRTQMEDAMISNVVFIYFNSLSQRSNTAAIT